MIVVLDASAAVKLVLDEAHSAEVRRVWDEPLTLLAPTIVVPEVAAAVHAAGRDGRLFEADERAAQRSWTALTEDIDLVSVDAALAERARLLAASRSVRGMDAVYLAVALMMVEADTTGLLSYDRRQRSAVEQGNGVALLPPGTD